MALKLTWVPSPSIQSSIEQVVHRHLDANLGRISVCICLPNQGGVVEFGGFHESEFYYPASVVKLFHLIYTLHLVDLGELTLADELLRAVQDMIRDSSNDATSLVVDAFSSAYSGPELSSGELEKWFNSRKQIDRWFESLGYRGLIVCQKTWNEGPYGREKQARGLDNQFCNKVTPRMALELLSSVMQEEFPLSQQSLGIAKDLLHRQIPADSTNADSQSKEFIGGALPSGARLWSKAGWTDEVRHDVAWVKLPEGRNLGLAVFTAGFSENLHLIAEMTRSLLNLL